MPKIKTADERLHDLDAKYLALTKENADATANLATMKKTGDELSNAKATICDLQKKIEDSNATIIDLQGDKAKLADNDIPVFPTIASRFNDPGVNRLFAAICHELAEKAKPQSA